LKIETITLNIDAYHEDPVSLEQDLGQVLGGIQAALAVAGHDPGESTFNLAFNLVDPDDKIGWSRYEMYRIRMQLGQIAAVLDGDDEEDKLTPEDRRDRRAMLLAHKTELETELHELEEQDDVTQKNPWE
jgi:hypothetical protein